MKAKVALLGSLIGAVGLVGFGSDANAFTRHWKSVACRPSATVIKHSRFGFVQDPGVRVRHSRTFIRERGEARIGIRERSEQFGVREHGRVGVSANVNVGERSGVQAQTNRAGTGANMNTGRSVSPGGNAASQTNSGGAASRGTSGAASPAGGTGGASSSTGGASSSSTK
ncbi:MAG: hypothetical protein NVSMB26_07410 [Beijerinckiaceae bacterium]